APVTSVEFPSGLLFRTALFGTETQLESWARVDANTTTVNGTSVLMAAADNANKVKLLLANGARAKYRAPSGHDAATVAASYRGSAASITRLLDTGADAEPSAEVKTK